MAKLRSGKIVILFCLFVFPIAGYWIGSRYSDSLRRIECLRSQSRFAQLELALNIYYEKHGKFPPTKYQPVADGPTHSWRVLLLPYTSREFIDRYSAYDFSKEWNNPSNILALGRTASPLFRQDGEGEIAHYLAIADGDAWPSRKALKCFLVKRGKEQFLLVEYSESTIHWMEPKY